jgi:hypothetical protein
LLSNSLAVNPLAWPGIQWAENFARRLSMLTMTTRAGLILFLLGVLSGCPADNKTTVDANSAGEQNGLNTVDPDALSGDPQLCVTVPTACPTQQPSYARDIAPIIAAKCTTCHVEGVDGGPWPLTEYSYISNWIEALAEDVEYCTMPPPGAAPLSEAEKNTLTAWFVCNAPNN